MTIEQLQDYINSKPDVRQLINAIADYMQNNPGGGGGPVPTLAEILSEGNNADGGTIENLADPTTDQQPATKKYVDDNSGGETSLPDQTGNSGKFLITNGTEVSWDTPAGGGSETLDQVLANGSQLTQDRTVDLNGKVLTFKEGGNDFLVLDPTTSTIAHTSSNNSFNGKMHNSGLPVYDTAAEAYLGGLTGGDFYLTNVDGEQFLKVLPMA